MCKHSKQILLTCAVTVVFLITAFVHLEGTLVIKLYERLIDL